MILTREGAQREEVELGAQEEVAAVAPQAQLPKPVCPQGVVSTQAPEDEELPPGVSALDGFAPIQPVEGACPESVEGAEGGVA